MQAQLLVFINSKITTMTYYIYRRNESGFVMQLGWEWSADKAILTAKKYIMNYLPRYGNFTIEVHANGVKSEKIFSQTISR
jgi:hypothetical protein